MQSSSRQSQTSYTSVPIREISAYYNQPMNQYSPRGTPSRTSESNSQFHAFRQNEYIQSQTQSQSRTPQSPSRMSSAYNQAMGVVHNMASKSPSRQSGYSGARSPSRPSEYAATERTERRQQKCYSPDGTFSRASQRSGQTSPSEDGYYTPLQKMSLIRELEAQILKSSKTSKKTSVENSFIAPKTQRRPEQLKVDTKAPALQDNFGKKIDQRGRGEYSPLMKPQKPEPKTGIRAFHICPPQANDENVRDHIKLAPPTVNLPKRNPIVQGDAPRSVRVRSTEQHPTYDYHLLNSRIHFLPSTREDRADKSPSHAKQLWNKTTMEHEQPKSVRTRIIPQNSSEGVKASLIYY